MNFNINEIISQIPEDMSDIEKIRDIYLKCGELFTYNRDYIYSDLLGVSGDLYEEQFNWLIVQNRKNGRIKATCNQIATGCTDAINRLRIEGKTKGNVIARNIGYVEGEEAHVATLVSIDDKNYFLDLYKDLYKIQRGLETKYYAVVNNKALIDIIDIIGGIYFDVPIDMDYDDPTQDLHIHLKKGVQLIDGKKAEQLLRFRHNNDNTSYPSEYGDNDFGRMKTQREFIKETINQTIKIENIFKSKKIIDSVFNNIDTNLDKKDLYPYIPKAVEFDTNNIENIQIPGESQKYNNLWFFNYYKKETKKLLENIN